ncbi:CidA/LrgA family protein [Deinococcus misasensis]|uniref:CidA/LrgA family protein n=1 Tax=Deinococcus misasensis TaxID=392413 RepID=UPI0005509A48|nr:CidA/LrgA family protein [Deinococcus misasensis]
MFGLLRGFCILLGFYALGEAITHGLNLSIPGSIVGMLMLWAALGTGLIRLEWVQQTSQHLLSVLGLLFVPAGVGIVLYQRDLAPLGMVLLGVMVVLLLTSFLVGKTTSRLEKPHE